MSKDWKKEFHSQFDCSPDLENFIEALLIEQRQEVIEECAKVAESLCGSRFCEHAESALAIRSLSKEKSS